MLLFNETSSDVTFESAGTCDSKVNDVRIRKSMMYGRVLFQVKFQRIELYVFHFGTVYLRSK